MGFGHQPVRPGDALLSGQNGQAVEEKAEVEDPAGKAEKQSGCGQERDQGKNNDGRLQDRPGENPGRLFQKLGKPADMPGRVPESEPVQAELMAEIQGRSQFPDRFLPGDDGRPLRRSPVSLKQKRQSVPPQPRRRAVEKVEDAPGPE